MGLCKCPRKKVTNLFCFEHRVNVCEHCLLETHERCVVQSYLEWLQDSDFDPNCTLCSRPLSDESEDVVRLMCLHLYHSACLERLCSSLPPTTPPAGYKCPLCRAHVIPRPNDASPVADRLRDALKDRKWARAGLGLTLLPEFTGSHVDDGGDKVNGNANLLQHSTANVNTAAPEGAYSQVHAAGAPINAQPSVSTRKLDHSRHQIDDLAPGLQFAVGRQPKDGDVGEAKYQRRSAMEWLARWLRSRNIMIGRRASKRNMLLLLAFTVFVVAGIFIFSSASGRDGGYDPFLDPLANPNIRIDRQEDVYGHMA